MIAISWGPFLVYTGNWVVTIVLALAVAEGDVDRQTSGPRAVSRNLYVALPDAGSTRLAQL